MTYKMPEGWEEIKLGDVVDNISVRPNKNLKKVVTINTSDVLDGKVLNHELVDNKGLPGQFIKSFKKDDILFSEIRPINKRNAYVDFQPDNYVASSKLMVLRARKDMLNPKFFYYYLTSKYTLDYLQVLAETRSGTFPQIRYAEIEPLKLFIPPIEEQDLIIKYLDIIDDKIELNNKINQNLEAQAQAIFKSWFIDFEPFQDGEFVENELGMIPKGWEVGKLGNSKLGKLITSGIEDYNGQKIYLATADVSETKIINNDTLITIKDRPSRANMQPRPNTIWFAKMKDSRKLILVDKLDHVLQDNYIFSTGFAGIQCTELSIYYLWTYIQSKLFDIKKNSLCTGTTMQAINNENINKIKILIPEKTILEKFNKIVSPMYQIIINTREQNTRLAELRDTLLPKLMSGEIRIPLDK